jgi:hypothetical protein
VLAGAFTQNSIHPAKTEGQVVGHKNGATGIGRENVTQCQLLYIGCTEIDVSNVREIQELREVWVKIGVSEKPILVEKRIFFAEDAGPRTQYKPALLIYFVECRHFVIEWRV